MYYTVYKITNRINNKIYIGVHKTSDLSDSYMGSGKLIKAAIAKHGIENFQKEYLAIFDNAEDMFKMESELVNEEFIHSSDSYNLKEGGHGGWDHLNSKEAISLRMKSPRFKNWGNSGTAKFKFLIENDKDFRDKHISQLFENSKIGTARRIRLYPNGTFKGKTHSDKSKKHMSASQKGKHEGKRNSQFGTMWITNQISNKKTSKEDPIPEGWMKGRVT